MKTAIDVKSRDEATAMQTALSHAPTRAAALIIGTLLNVPDAKSRRRVLEFVNIMLAEDERSPKEAP